MHYENHCSPKSFKEFISEIDKARSALGDVVYRGQRNYEWEIHSPLQRNSGSRISTLQFLDGLKPSQEIIQILDGKGCPGFEIARHMQQNYHRSKITGFEQYPGSPLIDFSLDPNVAILFANYEIDYSATYSKPMILKPRKTDAALYIVSTTSLPIYHRVSDVITRLKSQEVIPACIISPTHLINDLNDPKPKLQSARYIMQIDLENSIDNTLLNIEKSTGKKVFKKILLSKRWYSECAWYLRSNNITIDKIFPKV